MHKARCVFTAVYLTINGDELWLNPYAYIPYCRVCYLLIWLLHGVSARARKPLKMLSSKLRGVGFRLTRLASLSKGRSFC